MYPRRNKIVKYDPATHLARLKHRTNQWAESVGPGEGRKRQKNNVMAKHNLGSIELNMEPFALAVHLYSRSWGRDRYHAGAR